MRRKLVSGVVSIEEGETEWRFVPGNPRLTGGLQIAIDSTLEDIAGNNFRDLLDRPLNSASPEPSATQFVITLLDC